MASRENPFKTEQEQPTITSSSEGERLVRIPIDELQAAAAERQKV